MATVRTALALVVLAATLAAGCGGDEGSQAQPAASSTTQQAGNGGQTTETSTTTSAAATSSTGPGTAPTSGSQPPADATSSTEPAAPSDGAAEALAFFQSTEATCAAHAARVGNPAPEPERFAGASVVGQVGDGVWRILDGAGSELTVDVARGVVYGVDGPDGLMPHPYSFGCPEDLYLGSVAS